MARTLRAWGMVYPLLSRLIARFRRMSPEAAGVVASLATLTILALAMWGYAAFASAHKAETVKAAASHETKTEMAASAAAPPAPRPVGGQQGAGFIDRFEGRALHKRWIVSDGWSNGDWTSNDWRASQIGFTDHGLRITVEKAPEGSEKPLMGGEIRTDEFYRYGYFEIRMRMPRDPGIVMGFFTYAGQAGRTRPHEIDIEMLGRNTRSIELTLHQGGGATGKVIPLAFDAAAGFHTYGFEWRPDAVRWYADGKLIHQETKGRALQMDRPQQLMVSLWASKELHGWVGDLDIEKGPWHMDVSCVAYAPAYGGREFC